MVADFPLDVEVHLLADSCVGACRLQIRGPSSSFVFPIEEIFYAQRHFFEERELRQRLTGGVKTSYVDVGKSRLKRITGLVIAEIEEIFVVSVKIATVGIGDTGPVLIPRTVSELSFQNGLHG